MSQCENMTIFIIVMYTHNPLTRTRNEQVWIILFASALAQLVSCAVTCPVEAVRIRVMTCDKPPEFLSFVGTAQEMLDENGLAYFWSGLGALVFRELPFAIAKVGWGVLGFAAATILLLQPSRVWLLPTLRLMAPTADRPETAF